MVGYQETKRALQQIHRELMTVNPSAARSRVRTKRPPSIGWQLRQFCGELSVPRIRLESVFDTVRTTCRNVKRWRPGDQRERWIGPGLLFARNSDASMLTVNSHKLFAILDRLQASAKAEGRRGSVGTEGSRTRGETRLLPPVLARSSTLSNQYIVSFVGI